MDFRSHRGGKTMLPQRHDHQEQEYATRLRANAASALVAQCITETALSGSSINQQIITRKMALHIPPAPKRPQPVRQNALDLINHPVLYQYRANDYMVATMLLPRL